MFEVDSESMERWHKESRLEEGRIKFPLLASIRFRDHRGHTSRDKRPVVADGLVNGDPVFDPETDTLYVPALCVQEESDEPKRLLVPESNIIEITRPLNELSELLFTQPRDEDFGFPWTDGEQDREL
jgi:hypothetical protein